MIVRQQLNHVLALIRGRLALDAVNFPKYVLHVSFSRWPLAPRERQLFVFLTSQPRAVAALPPTGSMQSAR